MADVLRVDTPDGPGELVVDASAAPTALLVLGHGAGGGVDAWDLALLTRELPGSGVSVLRYRQPWLVAGRRVAGNPASLDRGWLPAVAAVREAADGVPVFVGGRSAGARCACRCFDASLAGLVALSFPLHPPGTPAKSRVAELAGVAGPVLVVQGASDPFGGPADVARALADAGASGERIVHVPGATHSLAPTKSMPAASVGAREQLLVGAVLTFIADVRDPVPAAE
ncbi:MAG: hydrolase [Propionicimonas sp.]|uniref:alpha/beta hydrolase family protein n=1 Tax=Propionicimonas sp. TaxID=1955623 RepID=UPI003D13BC51